MAHGHRDHLIAAGEAGASRVSAGPYGPAPHEAPQAPSVRQPWQDPSAPWIVVHHRADDGARVRLGLRRLGFEVHWPRQVHRVPRRDDVLRPFFPGYMFALADLPGASWHQVKASVPNVIQVCGVPELGRPVHPPRGMVLRLIQDAGGALDGVIPAKEDRVARLRAGDPVRVLGGPFEGHAAVYQCERGEDRVVVLLQLLGVERPVPLPRAAVAKA